MRKRRGNALLSLGSALPPRPNAHRPRPLLLAVADYLAFVHSTVRAQPAGAPPSAAAEARALDFLARVGYDAERARLMLSAQLGAGREYAAILRLTLLSELRAERLQEAREAAAAAAAAGRGGGAAAAAAAALAAAAAEAEAEAPAAAGGASGGASGGGGGGGAAREKVRDVGDGLADKGAADDSGLYGTPLELGLDIGVAAAAGECNVVLGLCSASATAGASAAPGAPGAPGALAGVGAGAGAGAGAAAADDADMEVGADGAVASPSSSSSSSSSSFSVVLSFGRCPM